MTVQELYDYALKHGITGCPVHVYVLDNSKRIEFISEHLDSVDYQADTEDSDGCLRIWVSRTERNNILEGDNIEKDTNTISS